MEEHVAGISVMMQCFVISPFGGDFDAIFEEIVAPSLSSEGYVAIRADTSDGSVNILKDIVNGIGQADLIIADLTGLNPNVMYELGLAHGLCKPVIILTQSIESLPFDLKAYRAYPYSVHFSEATKLARHIGDIAKKHRESLIEFGSPVSDFMSSSGRESLKSKHEQEELEPEEGKEGLLEKYLASHEAAQAMGRAFESISQDMNRLTERVGPSTDTLVSISSTSMSDHLKVAESIREAKVISSELTNFARSLRENRKDVEKFWPVVEDYGEFVIGLLDVLQLSDENVVDNAITYLRLNGVSTSVSEAVSNFRDSVKSVGFISSDLDRATKEAVRSIDPLISLLDVISASTKRFSEALMELADKRGLLGAIAQRAVDSGEKLDVEDADNLRKDSSKEVKPEAKAPRKRKPRPTTQKKNNDSP